MNIDMMPAGPEMDRLVAERVMANATEGGAATTIGVIATGAWSPSTNIAHAWEVVERMRAITGNVVNIIHSTSVNYCEFDIAKSGPDFNLIGAHADTAPLAICRAALKAVAS